MTRMEMPPSLTVSPATGASRRTEKALPLALSSSPLSASASEQLRRMYAMRCVKSSSSSQAPLLSRPSWSKSLGTAAALPASEQLRSKMLLTARSAGPRASDRRAGVPSREKIAPAAAKAKTKTSFKLVSSSYHCNRSGVGNDGRSSRFRDASEKKLVKSRMEHGAASRFGGIYKNTHESSPTSYSSSSSKSPGPRQFSPPSFTSSSNKSTPPASPPSGSGGGIPSPLAFYTMFPPSPSSSSPSSKPIKASEKPMTASWDELVQCLEFAKKRGKAVTTTTQQPAPSAGAGAAAATKKGGHFFETFSSKGLFFGALALALSFVAFANMPHRLSALPAAFFPHLLTSSPLSSETNTFPSIQKLSTTTTTTVVEMITRNSLLEEYNADGVEKVVPIEKLQRLEQQQQQQQAKQKKDYDGARKEKKRKKKQKYADTANGASDGDENDKRRQQEKRNESSEKRPIELHNDDGDGAQYHHITNQPLPFFVTPEKLKRHRVTAVIMSSLAQIAPEKLPLKNLRLPNLVTRKRDVIVDAVLAEGIELSRQLKKGFKRVVNEIVKSNDARIRNMSL